MPRMNRRILTVAVVIIVAVSASGRDRGVSRSSILRFEKASVGDAPIWPMGGVQVRTALFIAQFQGAPAITDPFAAQWRITWYSRDDIPALMQNPAWHAADPRYAAGSYSTRVWLRRFKQFTQPYPHFYFGFWCEASSLSVPAVIGTNQSHPLSLPGDIGLDDVIEVEARLGLGHWIEVNIVPGGPWYRVGGGILGNHGVGIASPSSVFTVGEPSYLRCD
jgi:hypothetical protein